MSSVSLLAVRGEPRPAFEIGGAGQSPFPTTISPPATTKPRGAEVVVDICPIALALAVALLLLLLWRIWQLRSRPNPTVTPVPINPGRIPHAARIYPRITYLQARPPELLPSPAQVFPANPHTWRRERARWSSPRRRWYTWHGNPHADALVLRFGRSG